MKAATFTGVTLHPYVAAHQAHKLIGNSQTQTGASVSAGRNGIGLSKGIENIGLLVSLECRARYPSPKHAKCSRDRNPFRIPY